VFLRSEQDNKFHSLAGGWKKAATWLAAFFLVGAICFEVGYRLGASSVLGLKDPKGGGPPVVETSTNVASASPGSTADLESKLVSVYVTGAVEHPGVYTAKATQRINDVVSLAGPKGDADLTRLNLASYLADEMMIYVPKMGEQSTNTSQGVQPSTPQPSGGVVIGSGGNLAGSTSSLININTADEKLLDSLPRHWPNACGTHC